jgi:hypothetical protein
MNVKKMLSVYQNRISEGQTAVIAYPSGISGGKDTEISEK